MTEALIDLPALLAPLADGDGGGTDPRSDYAHDSPYRRLKAARSEARDEERARDIEGGEADTVAGGWHRARQIGEQILTAQAKDIEVAVYVTEALVRQHGLPGLEAGSTLLTGMLESFWDNGFPLPDEDGVEDRAAFLGGLAGSRDDGTLMQPLRRITLFLRADRSPVSLYLYDQAEQTAGLPTQEQRDRRHEAGVPALEALQLEARAGAAMLRAVAAAAQTALDAWQKLDAVLTPRFPAEVPTAGIRRMLERILEITRQLIGDLAAPAESDAVMQQSVMPQGAIPSPGGTGAAAMAQAGGFAMADPSQAIASRGQALAALERIADYFALTEPHSPLAYTLRDAARRGRMTLPELLAEVLGDDTARLQMLMALGIQPPKPEE